MKTRVTNKDVQSLISIIKEYGYWSDQVLKFNEQYDYWSTCRLHELAKRELRSSETK